MSAPFPASIPAVPHKTLLRRQDTHRQAHCARVNRMAHLTQSTCAPAGARSMLFRLAAAVVPLLLSSCGGYGGGGNYGGGGGGGCGGAYGNACPTVTLTAPMAGAMVSGTVTLSATASAAGGLSVSRVDFMIDGTTVGTATTSPYSVSWNSTTVTKGSHTLAAKVTDSGGGTATTPSITITTTGMAAVSAAMSSAQMLSAAASGATGTARFEVSLETGAAQGTVTLKAIDATGVSINEAFAGARGAVVLALAPSAGGTGEWELPAGALLTADQIVALQQGKLYAIARSARHPEGEIRGQLLPENVTVTFSRLTASPAALSMGMAADGIAATTVDTRAGTLSVEVDARGVDDSMAARLVSGAARSGALPVELTKDSVDMGHWSVELASVSGADLAAFRAGLWSVHVATPVLPEGAIEGVVDAGRSD